VIIRRDRKKRNRKMIGGGEQKNDKEWNKIQEMRMKKERKAEMK